MAQYDSRFNGGQSLGCYTKTEKRESVASQGSATSSTTIKAGDLSRWQSSSSSGVTAAASEPASRAQFESSVSQQMYRNESLGSTIGSLHQRWLDSEYGEGQSRRYRKTVIEFESLQATGYRDSSGAHNGART